MRKVTFGGANSLDNYFAREDGGMDWLMWSDEAGALMNDYWPKVDCILMGRKTYEVALASQPQPAEGTDGAADPYGGISTYVFSRTLPAGKQPGGAEVIDTDPGEFVRALKLQDGKEICVMGGGELGSALIDAGVVDEIGFNIHPVLLGSGVPLFPGLSRQVDLELIECRPFKNGCVYVLYRVKGS